MPPRDSINPDYPRPLKLSGQLLALSLAASVFILMAWPFLCTSSGSVEVMLGRDVAGVIRSTWDAQLFSRSVSLLPPNNCQPSVSLSPQTEELKRAEVGL